MQRWLNEVMTVLQNEDTRYPLLIHCTSGKDRTGVVIAALLTLLAVPQPIIIEEYLLSQGAVKAEWIEHALQGIAEEPYYFKKINVAAIKKNLFHDA